jgi:DNA-binding NtrC family response regulator
LRPSLVDALGGPQLRMPTIQQRLPDLGLLLDDFIARARGAPAISRDACRCVLRYPFRQHVRAMARVIEGAATLAGEPDLKVAGGQRGTIEVVHLPVDVVGPELLRQIVGARAGSVPENTSEMAAVTTGSSEARVDAPDSNDPWFGADDATDPTQQRRRQDRPANAAHAAKASHGKTPPHGTAAPKAGQSDMEADDTGGHVDADTVAAALKAAHGNVSAAARALGRPRAVVQRWIREFRLDTGRNALK